MSITNDGERLVLVETPLPKANPRGLTMEWITWNLENNIPVYGADATKAPLNWKVVLAGLILVVGIVLIILRKKR